jgi:hypothetical protein
MINLPMDCALDLTVEGKFQGYRNRPPVGYVQVEDSEDLRAGNDKTRTLPLSEQTRPGAINLHGMCLFRETGLSPRLV